MLSKMFKQCNMSADRFIWTLSRFHIHCLGGVLGSSCVRLSQFIPSHKLGIVWDSARILPYGSCIISKDK
jgi:hypothetical protein